MMDLPKNSLSWIPLKNVLPDDCDDNVLDTNKLPALCSVEPTRGLRYVGSGDYPLDLVAATFILLTRWEEWTNPIRDQMGRHLEDATLCARQGFRDRPVLDEWALFLRPWLIKHSPAWRPVLSSPRIWISHDIDHLNYYKNVSRVGRSASRGLIKQKSLKAAFTNTVEGVASLINPEHDPCYTSISKLSEMDESLGERGTFFFMAANPSQYDEGYNISSHLSRKVIRSLREKGHEIGWHPGFIAADNDDVFEQELEIFKESLDLNAIGLRHHYLRWRACKSWRRMADNGIIYDSSMAYSGCLGFRASTSQYYPAYDLEGDVLLSLEVRPLVVMDGPLLGDAQMVAHNIDKMMRRSFSVNGVFSILIHNYTYLINHDIENIIYESMRK